jgi:ribosomal protein S27E
MTHRYTLPSSEKTRFVRGKDWIEGNVRCILCGHSDDARHVYRLNSIPIQCTNCGKHGARPVDEELLRRRRIAVGERAKEEK